MIALLPEYVYSSLEPRYEPLDEAPNYVRSSNATRWHRARSGHRFHDGRLSYGYWCGANYGHCGVESIGLDEPLCATCEGRFQSLQENQLLFIPRKSLPPTTCPASGREDMVPRTGKRYFHCLACGEIVAWRAKHRFDSGVAVQRHAPGEELVEPCRYHGWYRLVVRDERVVCACIERVAS